ncbi:MAG TPA: NADH-quinone oxidoreductase subunit NuoF [Spirochaetota bacterium]|nr:NADH-quinone oxidoreductase subunit NuoF [Spirochaetota bacterium]
MKEIIVKTRDDLDKIKESFIKNTSKFKYVINVCGGAGCVSSGCHDVQERLKASIKKIDMEDKVKVNETGCIGPCFLGPTLLFYPDGVFYTKVKPDDVETIVASHILSGKVVEKYCYYDTKKAMYVPKLEDIDFFKFQKKIVLNNCGLIDHASVDEYISKDGYFGIAKALTEMSPEQVIDEIKKSGLRGRGGGGFPTGLKWELGRKSQADQKYMICNADEGDPGAFMDRSLLEGDPHCVIEGMMIGGYAIGATKGVVYVRAEYPLAVERLDVAIKDARKKGILGKNLFGTGFDFDIEIRIGAGAFVCGEETALLQSVEGKRGEPRQKPPFPAQKGLFGKPTIINNVETFGSIPSIILHGGEWLASIGIKTSTGTKVFALAGDITNTGIVEVPMGMSLREILYDVGGGIPGNKKFKAAQTGGPSGGCITAEYLNTPVDYDSLTKLGTIMGSGGLIAMDEDKCMVDVARFFMEFVQDESCGKCVPCRLGTKRMLEILERITKGQGEKGDIELLEELGASIKDSALCGLGQTAPNPVLSTIRFFRDEYEAHVNDKKCPAGVCKSLLNYSILKEKCVGCTACALVCPVNAISGAKKQLHSIDQSKCVKCDSCFQKCRFDAIIKN